MTVPELNPSAPEDFAEPETKVIELPRPGAGGKRLAVRIKALERAVAFAAMEGLPGLGEKPSETKRTPAEMRQLVIENAGVERRVAELGVVEPRFAFKDGDSGPPWANVHPDNQTAIVQAIYELCGLFEPEKKGGSEEAAATFPPVAGQ